MSESEPATPQSSNDETQQEFMMAALRAPLPRFYANGFMTAQTASDIALIMLLNGNPSAVLNLSYISAKSLALELEKAVTSFERTIDMQLPTIEETTKRIEKAKADAVATGGPRAG
jgi:hypothetical protein